MTAQQLVEEFARWLWEYDLQDTLTTTGRRIPDNYLNEAAIFLAGPLGQQLQHVHELDRLRDEISDRANVEADLRAQLAEAEASWPHCTCPLDPDDPDDPYGAREVVDRCPIHGASGIAL